MNPARKRSIWKAGIPIGTALGWIIVCVTTTGGFWAGVAMSPRPDTNTAPLATAADGVAWFTRRFDLNFPSGVRGSEVAAVNLSCARALPGADGVDEKSALQTIDAWARRVEMETARHLYRFRQNPAEFNHSEAYYRMLTLVTVLQQDCGVRYNPERMQTPNFADSRDLFLHGLLTGKHEGTCVSMPVLYVAVGRRLGYPLKLVTSKAHVFARWESPDGRERLNIEATGQGLNCFPDEYYHTWPVPLTSAEIASGQYLKSLSPDEELAVFLSVRGDCLEAAGRLPEAQLAYAQAHQLAPTSTQYLAFLAADVRKEMPEWQQVRVDLGQVSAPTTTKEKAVGVGEEKAVGVGSKPSTF